MCNLHLNHLCAVSIVLTNTHLLKRKMKQSEMFLLEIICKLLKHMIRFNTPENIRKTDFLKFSGGLEMELKPWNRQKRFPRFFYYLA